MHDKCYMYILSLSTFFVFSYATPLPSALSLLSLMMNSVYLCVCDLELSHTIEPSVRLFHSLNKHVSVLSHLLCGPVPGRLLLLEGNNMR